MHTISNMADWNFMYGLPWKKDAEEMPADIFMQTAYRIHCTTTTNSQVSHVKTFRGIKGIDTTESHQFIEIDAELIFGIVAKILPHQRRIKMIKSSSNGRMRGK